MDLKGNDTVSPASDELIRWIGEASRGSLEAQKNIYLSVAPKLYRIVRRVVGETAAEDVTQDALLHLLSNLSKFRFESSFDTWAHRVAVNVALRHLRRQGSESQRIRNYAERQSMRSVCDANTQGEFVELVETALGRISGEQRAILHMKEIDGWDYRRISETLGIPVGTVGSRLNKARLNLKEELINLGWDG